MFVMASAVGINLITFNIIMKNNSPLYGGKFMCKNNAIDFNLICGAGIFGLGWGLSGLCPGPGMINFFILTDAVFWIIGLACGSFLFEFANKNLSTCSDKEQKLLQ